MTIVKLIHRWLGLAVGILLSIAALTGAYLSANDLVSQLTKPSEQFVPVLNTVQKATATNEIFAKYPKAKSITFPTQESPFFEIFNQGSRLQLDQNFEVIAQPNPVAKSVWRFMFFMHRNFHLGSVGAQANAIASALTVLLTVLGIVLLIPMWKAVKLKHAVPKNAKRSSLIRSHQIVGLFIAIPLIIAAATGLSLTWRAPVKTLLTNDQQSVQIQAQKMAFSNYGDAIMAAQALWPQDTLLNVFKRESRKGKGRASLSIRFATQNATWLNGYDSISLGYPKTKSATLTRFAQLPLNEQIYNLIRPLHDGTRLPLGYTVWLLITMLIASYVVSITTFSLARSLFKPK